jgi:hypothetical protein
MIEELKDNLLHICVCSASGECPFYVAHCLELDLIGEGETKPKARSSLEELIEIQWQVCDDNGLDLRQTDDNDQWKDYYNGEDTLKKKFVIQKHRSHACESVTLTLSMDKIPGRIVRNKDSWPHEYPLSEIEAILCKKSILFYRLAEKPAHGYFLGYWGIEGDGTMRSYPLYAPDGINIRWYHLRGIASRFGLDDFKSRLV